MTTPSVLVFSDTWGASMVLDALPPGAARALVAAEIRPEQHGPLRELVAPLGLPLAIQPRRSSPAYAAFVASLGELAPDLIVTNSYSMILSRELLALPRLGAVNLHGGLLPEFRGSNPIQWALLSGARECGATMHYMTAEVDAGDVIAERRLPITREDTWRTIHARLATATAELLREHLPGVLAGTAPRVPQDAARARTWPRRRPEDGRIDWDRSVLYLHDLVRALVKPHPGAFFDRGGERVVLDEYLTISEVVALKFGERGGRRAFGEGPFLVAPAQVVPSNTAIDLAVVASPAAREAPIGSVRLHGLEWDRGHVTFEGSAAARREAIRFALEFGRRELGLDLISAAT